MGTDQDRVDDDARPATPERERRARPLVARAAVLRWAWAAGIEVPDGPLDEMTIDLYLNRDDCGRTRTPGAGFELVPHEAEPDVIVLPAVAETPTPAPAPRPAKPEAFGPEPCATCGGPGYLDYVDLVRRMQLQRCRRCGTAWESAIAH